MSLTLMRSWMQSISSTERPERVTRHCLGIQCPLRLFEQELYLSSSLLLLELHLCVQPGHPS